MEGGDRFLHLAPEFDLGRIGLGCIVHAVGLEAQHSACGSFFRFRTVHYVFPGNSG